MSIHIPPCEPWSFELSRDLVYGIALSFTIDLNQTVREKSRGEVLTNESALKIFKQIKLKSDILSFLTKPVVFFPLVFAVAPALTAISCSLPVIHGAMAIVRVAAIIISFVVGAFGVGLFWAHIFKSASLSELSQAYNDQSIKASQYIMQIETAKKPLQFIFD